MGGTEPRVGAHGPLRYLFTRARKLHSLHKGEYVLEFDAFYEYDRLTQFLHDMAARVPDLVKLSSLVRTPEGRDVWCVEVAGAREGLPLQRRPAFLATGNMHAIEYAGSLHSLHLLETLVEGYPSSPEIQRLLNEHVVYIIPRIAADGAEYGLETLDRVRSKRIPVTEKNAILPQDINGDGRILTMRWQSPQGTHVMSEEDPRLLVPRTSNDTEGPFYHTATEGMIHEWDGGPVRGSHARSDFNRNFPAHWRPFHDWIGHGKYPLSEVETRAVADFVLAHPNIVTTLDFHTGNPAIFYPSGTVSETARHPADARAFEHLGRIGEAITEFPYLSGYLEAKTGEKTEKLPGSFLEWMYEHVGNIVYVIESGLFYNYLGVTFGKWFDSAREREVIPGVALLSWHDAHPEHELFFEWQPVHHPQLGPVEVGGWNWVLWSNPPLHEMEAVSRRSTEFALRCAAHVPRLDLELKAECVEADIYKLTAHIRNVGPAPTSVTLQGEATHPHAKPNVRVGGGEIEFVIGQPECVIDHLGPGQAIQLEWVIRTESPEVTLEVESTRGLFAHKGLPLRA